MRLLDICRLKHDSLFRYLFLSARDLVCFPSFPLCSRLSWIMTFLHFSSASDAAGQVTRMLRTLFFRLSFDLRCFLKCTFERGLVTSLLSPALFFRPGLYFPAVHLSAQICLARPLYDGAPLVIHAVFSPVILCFKFPPLLSFYLLVGIVAVYTGFLNCFLAHGDLLLLLGCPPC